MAGCFPERNVEMALGWSGVPYLSIWEEHQLGKATLHKLHSKRRHRICHEEISYS